MTESEPALIRWVKGADNLAAPSSKDSVPVHPQHKAEHFNCEWQSIWCPQENVDPNGILLFLTWIPAQGYACPEPTFQMECLQSLQSRRLVKHQGLMDGKLISGFYFLVVFILLCPCCGAKSWMLVFCLLNGHRSDVFSSPKMLASDLSALRVWLGALESAHCCASCHPGSINGHRPH